MIYDTVNSTSNNLLILWYERDGRILVWLHFTGFFAFCLAS